MTDRERLEEIMHRELIPWYSSEINETAVNLIVNNLLNEGVTFKENENDG